MDAQSSRSSSRIYPYRNLIRVLGGSFSSVVSVAAEAIGKSFVPVTVIVTVAGAETRP